MAKIELVKETTIDGVVRYSIEKDGIYISRSITNDLEEAERFFKIVSQTGNLDTIKETIKTIEVDEDNTND